tara:strand:+ start:2044 stop:2490 length:447 start_codon:yes stop_codon:yes gene_type:complete
MRASVLAAVAFFAVGCAHTPVTTKSLLEDFPRTSIPKIETRASEPGWCDNAQPIGPGIDPDCIGMLVPPNRLDALLDEADLLGECRKSLDLSYNGRQSDRDYALSVVQAREEQLRIAKEMQPKLFAVGAASGAGSAALLFLVALLASR